MLVYFKETQTPQDKWDVGPGKWANSEEAKAKGAVPGQAPRRPSLAPPVPPTNRAATAALVALAADVDRARSPLAALAGALLPVHRERRTAQGAVRGAGLRQALRTACVPSAGGSVHSGAAGARQAR